MSDYEGADLQDMARRDGVQTDEEITAVRYINGKRMYVGASGGVFAPQGGFYGSYFTLPEDARNDPNRRFTDIRETASGYELVAETGETYGFYNDYGQQAPAPGTVPSPVSRPAEPAAPAPAAPTMTTEQRDAWAFMESEFESWGLPGMGELAKQLIIDGAGDAEVMRRVRETDTYKTRFKGMEARRQKGLNPISEGEYMQLEDSYRGIMRRYGMPSGLYDSPDDFATYIGNDLSVDELNERVVEAAVWARDSDPFEKEQLRQLYGWSDGDFLAAAIDPDKALPYLYNRRTATEIAAQGARTGWGQLTTEEAERLANMGITEEGAAEGFGELATFEPLFQEGIGESDGDITREQQLGAAFGNDVQAQQAISRRARARRNAAQAGGGAVQTQTGTGIGTAT